MTLLSQRHRFRHHLRETFGWRESDLGIWQGAKFTLDTCVPALAGLLLGQPELGFIGALAGSLFSFSDVPGTLSSRWLRLVQITVAMILFGILGFVIGAKSPLFWVTLLGLVCGASWLQLASHPVASPVRWGAIALISTAGLPSATWSLAWMVLFAALINAVTVFVGSQAFPDAAPFVQPVKEVDPRSLVARVRFCIVCALAAVTALLIGQARGVTHPMWITTTVLLVMQPDARSSLTRILQRSWGTLLGVVAAALTVGLFHSAWPLFFAIVVLSYTLPHASVRNYWLQTALFAWLILILYEFASVTHFNRHLIGERLLDVSIGCAIAFVATVFAFTHIRKSTSHL